MDSKTSLQYIRALNDSARRNPTGRCTVLLTDGITGLSADEQSAIWSRVSLFRDFTEANDPHGEHDFGSFVHKRKTIFWKFDYYDLLLKYGSPNPADRAVTRRVLTVMLADEY